MRSYDFILGDEIALAGEPARAAFQVNLRPTLDKPNSKAVFISTPRGIDNPFYDWYKQGLNPDFAPWVSAQSDYRENPRLSADDIEEAKKSMPHKVFQQEYCADFSSQNEGVVYSFNFEEDIMSLRELERILHISASALVNNYKLAS